MGAHLKYIMPLLECWNHVCKLSGIQTKLARDIVLAPMYPEYSSQQSKESMPWSNNSLAGHVSGSRDLSKVGTSERLWAKST